MANLLGAQTLVVGTRGFGSVAGRLLGSVSRRLAEHSPCPVVIVPPGLPDAHGPIVVGLDGSEGASSAMLWAVDVAQASRSEIIAVHGIGLPTFELAGSVDDLLLHGQALVDGHCQQVMSTGVKLLTEVQVVDPRVLIDRTARSSQASLIVLGARGAGSMEGLLIGSVATYVSQHSDRPVALVRPPATSGG